MLVIKRWRAHIRRVHQCCIKSNNRLSNEGDDLIESRWDKAQGHMCEEAMVELHDAHEKSSQCEFGIGQSGFNVEA
jgi:hypothetical protein